MCQVDFTIDVGYMQFIPYNPKQNDCICVKYNKERKWIVICVKYSYCIRVLYHVYSWLWHTFDKLYGVRFSYKIHTRYETFKTCSHVVRNPIFNSIVQHIISYVLVD